MKSVKYCSNQAVRKYCLKSFYVTKLQLVKVEDVLRVDHVVVEIKASENNYLRIDLPLNSGVQLRVEFKGELLQMIYYMIVCMFHQCTITDIKWIYHINRALSITLDNIIDIKLDYDEALVDFGWHYFYQGACM